MSTQQILTIETRGRGFEMITSAVANVVERSGVRQGLCNVFIRHTSASLVITENADSAVRRDLERFMQRVAPDGSPDYEHDTEGPDDMPAHIRNALTSSALSVPIVEGRLGLGTWQGIYVWEHRTSRHAREVIVTVIGEH
jgi:secondary thiamine-phosphate synthase enzyme